MFGYETDGIKSMKTNVDALLKLGFENANFSIPCPYPGTYLYDVAQDRGLIGDEEEWLLELADRDISERVINMSNMSDEELHRIIQWGKDQLILNNFRSFHPYVGGIIYHLQPMFRKFFNMDALNILQKTWYFIRYGRFSTSDVKNGGNSGANDEYIREEAFQLLESWSD